MEKLQQSKRKIDQIRVENLPKVLKKLKEPLKDAAMMNATRWALYNRLKETGLLVECGSGARTKYNRIKAGLPKTHYYDACCVGKSTPENIVINQEYIQVWVAIGRGSRKMCNTNKHGFPISHRSRQKVCFGFMTGDLAVVEVPRGKYAGRWIGRVAVRSSGYFDVKDGAGKRACQGISYKHFRLLQRADGWQYEKEKLAG